MSDFPTLTIGRYPDISPAVTFACAMSLGVGNFLAWRETRAARRDTAGVWEQPRGYEIKLEAFAPSRRAIEAKIAEYIAAYPIGGHRSGYRTKFELPVEFDGEFIAHGARFAVEGWI